MAVPDLARANPQGMVRLVAHYGLLSAAQIVVWMVSSLGAFQ